MWQRWVLSILITSVLAGCATSARAPVGDRTQRPLRTPEFHTVRQGDTLYSVAFLYGYPEEKIAAWNGLRPPYTIYRKQRLRLRPPPVKPAPPVQPSRAKVTPAPAPQRVPASRPKTRLPAKSQPKSSPRMAPVVKSTPRSTTRQPEPLIDSNRKVIWSWPVKGTLIKRYSATGAGRKGIDIAGKNGQSVKAAASGRVVYSGSGLSGYGRLIILKHNKDFLSAYAHNRKLIAREGQWVNKGEVIAQMGSSGTDRVKLHFEIRKQGKPVDPLRYLPRR